MFTEKDHLFLQQKGITEAQIEAQLQNFKAGFPYLQLAAAASIGNGIEQLDEDSVRKLTDTWQNYSLDTNHRIVKFVPASGAASRMFKNLFEFLNADYNVPQTDFEKKFFEQIKRFAFYEKLNQCCTALYAKEIDTLIAENSYKCIVKALLSTEGLNYGNLPKGLLLFHKYAQGARTPLEEHLVEGALYAGNSCCARIHFTVSPEHRPLFEQLVKEKQQQYETLFGITYDISFSEQKSSTDTIAVDMNNQPFRNDDGTLLFRPGGHGALIENLNDLDADIIFVKNIDNVVPDTFKDTTVQYKKVIAGLLVAIQQQIFDYLRILESGRYTQEQLIEIVQFVQRKLHTRYSDIKNLEDSELAIYLIKKLNRPIRVCGMVKNEGEPGGGPFLAYNQDNTISLQILESSQIDFSDNDKKNMFEQGTHFNPVDLVCGVKNYKGEKFDLTQHVDKRTGFISQKSKNGKDLKALELPGLWNGAMSDWNTIFVEVPAATFNPVKTVNDLLRTQHQSI